MLPLEQHGGASSRQIYLNRTDMSAAIWAAFWLAILTAGSPDLLDAIVGLLSRL